MGQLTDSFVRHILELGKVGAHASFTVNEEQQLAFAWLQRERFREALREIAGHVGEDSQLDINAKNMRDTAREALVYGPDRSTDETEGDANGK